jgi:hypothetical protein
VLADFIVLLVQVIQGDCTPLFAFNPSGASPDLRPALRSFLDRLRCVLDESGPL